MNKRIILGITGASGALLALEFVSLLSGQDVEIHAIISDAGLKVMELEQGLDREGLKKLPVEWFKFQDFTAPMASGSARYDGMVILPCSMGTLAAVANGLSHNLIQRAADVTLKEGRPLLMAVRETPFNRNHLRNMLKAHDAGALICPPMPSFYFDPQSINEMAAMFCGRLADLLEIDVPGLPRWGDDREESP